MRRGRGGTLERQVARSLGFPLAGGAAIAVVVVFSQAYWWVGPAAFVAVVLAVLVLCRL